MQVPVLLTPRLRLRPLSLADAPGLFAVQSDRQTVEYWGNDVMSTLDEAKEKISEILDWTESGSSVCWALELLEKKGLVGTCTLFRLDEQNRHAEVGYILNRGLWGQGLMSEALAAMIDHAFNTMDLHRLEADTDPRNAGSLALLRKFGFRHEGYFRERWYVHGQWLDSDMLGLLRSEYPPGEVNPGEAARGSQSTISETGR